MCYFSVEHARGVFMCDAGAAESGKSTIAKQMKYANLLHPANC